MKYGYYPGCSLLSTALEYARSAEGVLQALGVELEEVEDWVCCGATAAHATSHLLSVALPAISCAAAERQGNDILTLCSACYNRLKQVNQELRDDPELLAQTNQIIEEEYRASINVLHLTEVLARQIGIEAIRSRVRTPLTGLKVASYYGCLIARLPESLQIESAENPVLVDELMSAVGAEPVDWPHKTECCGAALTLSRQDIVIRLSGEVVDSAKECGADVLAVVCPLCQTNLDMYQANIEGRRGTQLGVPVLFFTQLMAVAMGLEPEQTCLEKGIVDPLPILLKKGLVPGEVYL
jgi:heterodisulfide reductase subunit B